MRLARPYWCGTDTVTGQGIACIDDLAAKGYTFGTPLEAWPVQRVLAGVEQLAALHAKTWGAKLEEYPWLTGESAVGESGLQVNPYQATILSLLTPEAWSIRFGTKGEIPPVKDFMIDRERIKKAYITLWRTANPRFRCVIHGDPHTGNTFITPEGPGFLDYQGCSVGTAFHDISYFVAGALSITDRREHEESIIDHYLESLAKLGGPRFERKDPEVWDEYRKQQLTGFAWALCAPQMQARDIIWTMTERHTAALEDHKTLQLLEALS
jgi:hypothetical protein